MYIFQHNANTEKEQNPILDFVEPEPVDKDNMPIQMSFSESEVCNRRAASFRISDKDKEQDLASLDEDDKETSSSGVTALPLSSQPIPIKFVILERFLNCCILYLNVLQEYI